MIFECTIACLSVQIFGYLISITFLKGQEDKYYDMFGCLGFLVQFAYYYYTNWGNPYSSPTVNILVFFLVLWSVRLGSFLIYRAHLCNGDRRFDKIKGNPVRFAITYFLQFVWNIITLWPSLLVLSKDSSQIAEYGSSVFHYIGTILFIVGFLLEFISDGQKLIFKQRQLIEDKANPEQAKQTRANFIRHGLWKISRHPNYLGEFTIWFGVYFYCFSEFTAISQYISIISPVFIYLLITYVSGIKILERQADKKWGSLKEYQDYKKNTPVLLPRLI